MLTILEVINKSTDYLSKKGVEDPKLNAELLLCHILKCKRINLYLNFDKPLAGEELEEYRINLKRRGSREPLQYITGVAEFYGMQFKVSPAVLIPRPETELLVETVIKENTGREVCILDIGTGSGNIAVSLAKYLPGIEIKSIDVSSDSLMIAAENASNYSLEKQIIFEMLDIFSEKILEFTQQYDVIVSNPPYISAADFKELEPELKVYEPAGALSDHSDGLSFYRRITQISYHLLKRPGKLYMELGAGQSNQIIELLKANGFSDINVVQDYQNIDRVISGELK